MEPYYADDLVTLHHSKCEAVLPALPEASIDACVTDPPYGLSELPRKQVEKALAAWLSGDRLHVPDGRGFMGAEWDKFVPPPGVWDEVYRVLKPGAYLLAFAAPRTADLMGLSIRLAGFSLVDSLHWVTGQGFPKAKSRLKPAHEPIIMARKPAKADSPLPGLDACRVAHTSDADRAESEGKNRHADFASGPREHNGVYQGQPAADRAQYDGTSGRWPPNLLLVHDYRCNGTCADGCPVAGIDAQSGMSVSRRSSRGERHGAIYGNGKGPAGPDTVRGHQDTGGASRFFPQFTWDPEYDLPFMYSPKAPKSERLRLPDGTSWPTVKPLALMRWLVRLVTPPGGGLVLDPFAGTGPTGQACALEGFRCILAERDPVAAELASIRLRKPVQPQIALCDMG